MARVLAISSQVVFGPVGLSAIVPALQAEGHEVLAVPTVLLSNHPGHGKPAGGTINIEPLLKALGKRGMLQAVDAVITGYFATGAQVATAAKVIASLNCKIVMVDPVIGDHGKLYVPEEVANGVRECLLPLATIATPNAFELSWLTGKPVNNESDALAAAAAMKTNEVVATSIPAGEKLVTLRIAEAEKQRHEILQLAQVPHGTGDYLAGLYLARVLAGERSSGFSAAMAALESAIGRSAGTSVLMVR